MSETFTWGNAGEKLTPSDRRRRMAEAMMLRGADASPIKHWTQGAARVAEALLGRWEMNKLDAADTAGQASVAADAALLAPSAASSTAAPSAPSSPAASTADPSVAVAATPAALAPVFASKEAQFGLPANYLAQTAKIESGFNPDAKNPNSSATGLFQFVKGTARQYGLANPRDPIASTDAAARLAADNKAQLVRVLGREPTAGELYLAHQQGGGGATKLLSNPNARAVDVVGADAVRLNGGNANMKAGEFARRWTSKLAANEADMPAPNAALAEAPTGQTGFAIPQGRSVESIPGDDPAKLRAEAQAYAQTNPEAARQMLARADAAEASAAPAPMPPARPADLALAPPAAPAMTGQTFDQITQAQPLDPVFQSEGVSQPWMGTAVAPQPAMVARAAPTTLPPPRPADLPAPGAVEAVGQLPPQSAPQMMPDLSNTSDGGMRALQVQAEQARQSQPAAPQEPMNPLARVAAAFTGGGQQAAPVAAPSPAVARVAEAVGSPAAAAPAAPVSPGVDRVATAMRVLNSPYAQPGQKAMATMVIQQAFKDPTEAETKKLDLEIKRKSLTKSDDPTPIQEYNLAVKQGETRSYTDWKTAQTKAGATSVNVNGGGSDKQIFDTVKESSDAARSAATGLNAVREARAAVKGGAFLGAGADAKLALQKIGASLGVADPSKIVNTETFRSAIAPAVASLLKSTVGSANISNSDREFAEKAAGGSISLDEGTITRLLDIMERGNVTILEGHQKRMDAIYPDEVANKRERALFGVPMPAAPAPPPAAAAPDRAALEAEARRRGLIK